jgi:hypothetical protein
MTIKEIFSKAEGGTLTFEQFEELAKDAKFADLSLGEYVSKKKYEDELSGKDKQIETLNGTIKTREADLKALNEQLENAGEDKTALDDLNNKMKELQSKYDTDTKAYKAQLAQQSYEFAVKEFANTKEFSSDAAKRDFIRQFEDAKLKMDGDTILGADDFLAKYREANENAFVVKSEPAPQPEPDEAPKFVAPTDKPAGKKLSLTELMRMKNDNPDVDINNL